MGALGWLAVNYCDFGQYRLQYSGLFLYAPIWCPYPRAQVIVQDNVEIVWLTKVIIPLSVRMDCFVSIPRISLVLRRIEFCFFSSCSVTVERIVAGLPSCCSCTASTLFSIVLSYAY